MKKVFLMAVLVFASAAFNSVSAQSKKKDKKNKQKTECAVECKKEGSAQPVQLKTASDSLSYAAGVVMTRGLEEYIGQQFGVTKAQMPMFMKGLRQGFDSRNDSTFAAYVAGLTISQQVQSRMLPNMEKQFEGTSAPIQGDLLYKGFLDALQKDTTYFTSEAANNLFNAKQAALIAQKEAELKAKNEAFLAENKKKEGVVVLPDGLQYRIIKKGTGATPKASDAVRVVYEGKTIDGKVFDATSKHGAEYDTFNVGGLIKGWTEVLQLMPVGSKWEVFIPQDLAYGSRGAGKDIAPYSTLIFTLELKGIEPATVAMPEAVKKVKETPVTKTSPAKKVAKKTVKK